MRRCAVGKVGGGASQGGQGFSAGLLAAAVRDVSSGEASACYK